MTRKKSANRPASRRPPKTAWKPGESGNPAGRPKDGESWASVIKEVSNMNVEEILLMIGETNDLGRQIRLLPRGVQVKYLVTARVIAALMFEPTAGLWSGLMDRAEGKVPDRLQLDHKLQVEGLSESLEMIYGSRNDPKR